MLSKLESILSGILELDYVLSETKFKIKVKIEKKKEFSEEIIIKLFYTHEQDIIVEFIA